MYAGSATNKGTESHSCGFGFIFGDGIIKKGLIRIQQRVKLVLAHSQRIWPVILAYQCERYKRLLVWWKQGAEDAAECPSAMKWSQSSLCNLVRRRARGKSCVCVTQSVCWFYLNLIQPSQSVIQTLLNMTLGQGACSLCHANHCVSTNARTPPKSLST